MFRAGKGCSPIRVAWLSRLKAVSLVIAIGLCARITTQATPIVFEYTGSGSGSLGGRSFNNASITIIADADTSQIALVQLVPFHPPVYQVPDLFTSIIVAGIGTAIITNTSSFVNFTTGGVGIGDFRNADIFDVVNSVFQTYTLDTSIGPVAGSPLFNSGAVFATSDGNLNISALSDVSYQATLEPVPEPGICAIIAAGTTAFFGLRRKLQK